MRPDVVRHLILDLPDRGIRQQGLTSVTCIPQPSSHVGGHAEVVPVALEDGPRRIAILARTGGEVGHAVPTNAS
jgi:hypothetical protein